MLYDPKDPEQAFILMDDLRENAANLRNTILNQTEEKTVHTKDFINDILEQQSHLIDDQDFIHQNINSIEIEWSKATSVQTSQEKYQQAVKFFQDKEEEINEMTQQMHKLTKQITEFPH